MTHTPTTTPDPAPTPLAPGSPATSTPHRTGRRWPLLLIGASAGTATWSGWVGLGEFVGFGLVHPLPGIADDFTINTAITLPIGVEAYAVYALSIATSPRALDARTRTYAWASAVAALVLGMAGQVTYHLLAAAGHTRAPWQIVAVVSCLPVVVLGAASVLWHLTSHPDTTAQTQAVTNTETGATTPQDEAATQGDAPLAQPTTPTPRAARPPRKTSKNPDTAATLARLRARHPEWTHAQLAQKAEVSVKTVSRHLNTPPMPPTRLTEPEDSREERAA